jgi:hypothetical protein
MAAGGIRVSSAIIEGKVRAITVFPATVSDKKAFLERPQ